MKLFKSLFASLALVAGLLTPMIFVAPAQAATISGGSSNANVYLVVRDSVCVKPGHKVRSIIGNVNTMRHSWTLTHYDTGDNIIYPRVRLNEANGAQLKVACFSKQWWGWKHESWRTVHQSFRPTHHNGTVWVG